MYFLRNHQWSVSNNEVQDLSIFLVDVDECRSMPGACEHGRCMNTMGSYRCICNPGYETDVSATRCIDEDECRQLPSPCEFTCRNTAGSYVCSCPAGYTLNVDRHSCKDIDECVTRRNDCQYTCVNIPGSYKCSCPDGFRQRENSCFGTDNSCLYMS